ncbi:hypothetical protein BDW74DRAFT_164376 [Aspergillus multicolor]|uniref:diacylglycerol/lipid kinase family protein n=1 Tax=Aspergillus multicolor TaxID=41759 RepID=UPI003CCDAD0D
MKPFPDNMPQQSHTLNNNIYNNCFIVGDAVQCSGACEPSITTILVADIICILPNGDSQEIYTILFVQKEAVPAIPLPKVERVHVKTALPTALSKFLLIDIPKHLCYPTECHAIISTGSGTGTAQELFNSLRQTLAWIGLDQYKVHETQSPQTITELCHSTFIPRAEAGIPQTIVLISGDGGLCDIIDSFHGTPKHIRTTPNIALFPAGTGNAMASSTGLLDHPKTAIMALLQGNPSPLPVFAATFSQGARYSHNGQTQSTTGNNSRGLKIHGSVVASWGIHAALVADSDTVEYRKFGADRFKMAAKELLFPSDGSEAHKYNGTLTLLKQDGQNRMEREIVIEHKQHVYVLATLVSNLEKEFRISPLSVPLDGSFRIVRFGPISSQRVMQLLSAAYQDGQHVRDSDVMYSEIQGFLIHFHEVNEKWRRVCIDGRVVIVEENGWMNVHKEKRSLVNILMPELLHHNKN